MTRAIALYLHVHQPYRIRHYTVFDIGNIHNYFDSAYDDPACNERILRKVAEKSYLPTNAKLLKMLEENKDFKLSLSITGTVLDQLKNWSPDALISFKKLFETGRVEIVAETYHHSLAFFYSKQEFERQVEMHRELVNELFGVEPKVFRNTELAYNNDLAKWAENAGYKGVLAEGWDKVLDWKSPNYVYKAAGTNDLKLLLKNYRLSDDIAFRFGDHEWSEYPLTADKFSHWLSEEENADVFNLFMDYETFGEHQWEESGVFHFLETLPKEWLKTSGHTFMTVSEAMNKFEAKDTISVPETVTWADTERDLSAWLGNSMQSSSIEALYSLENSIMKTNNWELIEDWRKLQTSDHFYYMCTKWFNDGDIHAYFSPYENPYDSYINFTNALRDLQLRLHNMQERL